MSEGTVAADQLRLFIERVERLEEEKKSITDDVRDVYAEAKANGYDPKIMRMCVRLRKLETHARQEQDAVFETYREALGIGSSGHYSWPAASQAVEPTALESAIEERLVADGYVEGEDGAWRAPSDSDGICETPIESAPAAEPDEPPAELMPPNPDEVYADAVELVTSSQDGEVSPLTLSNKLRISYEAMDSFMARMQRDGIVGPANALNRRQVLQHGTVQ